MMAEELAHYVLRNDVGRRSRADSSIDDETGRARAAPKSAQAFRHGTARPLAPSAVSQEHRLSRIFARVRTAAVQAVAPRAASQGPLAAHYVLALRELSAK